jgi:peptidyl-prolyl cis-trans isomerase C
MKILVPLFCIALLAGCSKSKDDKTVSATPMPPAPSADMATPAAGLPPPVAQPAISSNTVLMEVNGEALTAGDIEQEVRIRMLSIADQIPPEMAPQLIKNAINVSMEKFMVRALLQSEAVKKGLAVTETDRKAAMEDLARTLPEGMNVEEFIKSSSLGEERINRQINTQILINKLLSSTFTNSTDVSDQELDEFIEKNKENLTLPETVRARHVLLLVPEGTDEAKKAEIRKKADTVQAKLAEGADFEATAKEFSECPSKEHGGDLGTFPRDKMVKAFSDAAFSQKLKEIGAVVETSFGYHIIQVTEKNEAGIAPRDEIRQKIQMSKQQGMLAEYVDGLRKDAKIKSDMQLPLEPWFTL